MDGGGGEPLFLCLPLPLPRLWRSSSHTPPGQGSCSLGAVNPGEQTYTSTHIRKTGDSGTSCPKKQDNHTDTFVPLSSDVKSCHGSQDRCGQTAEQILTICTKPFCTPVLVGSPPGGVLEIRQLLFSPPSPDGQTETQRDINGLPNPSDRLMKVRELICHSPGIYSR